MVATSYVPTVLTPNDGTDINPPVQGLMITVTGNVTFLTQGGESITIASVAANTVLPFAVKRLMATGTTATNILGLRG